MPIIEETIEIKAKPEAVYDLIVRIEDFSLYTGIIKEITAVSPRTYHWTVRIDGISLEWDALITEQIRPERFAWRSVAGVANSGSYTLAPIPAGTKVSFSMEYHLPSRLLEKTLAPLVEPLIRQVSSDILAAVKDRLERHHAQS